MTAPTETAEIAALRVKANAGDADAQFSLGEMYATKVADPQDDGHTLLRKLREDFAQAKAWYRKSAEQGHADAQNKLGRIYHLGTDGVSEDMVKALAWYRKSVEQGNAGAQYNLGVMYQSGQGVPKDAVSAYMWFNLAAAQLTGEDQKTVATWRESLALEMTQQQIAEAQTLAREWLAAFEKRGGK